MAGETVANSSYPVHEFYRLAGMIFMGSAARQRLRELWEALYVGQPELERDVPRKHFPTLFRALLAAGLERLAIEQFVWRLPDSGAWQHFLGEALPLGERPRLATPAGRERPEGRKYDPRLSVLLRYVREDRLRLLSGALLEQPVFPAAATSLLKYLREDPRLEPFFAKHDILVPLTWPLWQSYLQNQIAGATPGAPTPQMSTPQMSTPQTSGPRDRDARPQKTPRVLPEAKPRPPQLACLELFRRRTRGGVVKLTRADGSLVEVALTRLQCSVFHELMAAARDAGHDEWSCLAADELVKRLHRQSLTGPKPYFGDRNSIAKCVYKIRQRLEEAMNGGKWIVETHPLGYRLNTQAELLIRAR